MPDLSRIADGWTQIVTSGPNINNNSFGAESLEVNNTVNLRWYADFRLRINPSTAPNSNGRIIIHQAFKALEGANDGPVPDVNFKQPMKAFETDAATGDQWLFVFKVVLPFQRATYKLENTSGQGTGIYDLWINTWTPRSS